MKQRKGGGEGGKEKNHVVRGKKEKVHIVYWQEGSQGRRGRTGGEMVEGKERKNKKEEIVK